MMHENRDLNRDAERPPPADVDAHSMKGDVTKRGLTHALERR